MLAAICVFFAGCSPVEIGGNSEPEETESKTRYEDVSIPEIKSDDSVMPTFFDISLYDEENYADIYLGKKYGIKFIYSGSELKIPSSYKSMTKSGWSLAENGEYQAESLVMAGKSAEVYFENEYRNIIKAVFYNAGGASQPLKKCSLVKLSVAENNVFVENSSYGQFWINGVCNESAITDVIEYLGAPSHFYAVSSTCYYLDYFLYERDKRSRITVYIDVADDSVSSVEIAYY